MNFQITNTCCSILNAKGWQGAKFAKKENIAKEDTYIRRVAE